MGLFKILAIITIPTAAMTYSAFSLGKQLPKACRKFGNYIGLSYIYFKCILKTLKPEDQMPYDMLQMARKATQQSQALRRQLRNSIKKAKDDLRLKHEQTLANLNKKIEKTSIVEQKIIKQQSQSPPHHQQSSGSQLIKQLQLTRTLLIQKKKLKKQSRNFIDNI